MKSFQFTHAPIDTEAARQALGDPAAGGYASFEGWVRNHNEGLAVTRLEYEAFEELAIREGERIVASAIERFGVEHASCVHRVGALAIGEMAVWVGVSARHRAEAFDACRYIIDEVKHRVPIWKKEHYVNGDSGWVNCERCAEHAHEHDEQQAAFASREDMDAGHAHADALTRSPSSAQSPAPSTPLLPDYSRQTALREVGEAGQAKLRVARVLVIGAGGLGAPVLSYLAGAGVGKLGIADGDVLEASNLHRQTLYRLADIGLPKVELAARSLRELNPLVDVRVHAHRVSAHNIAELLAEYDLAVDCSDNFATKFVVNDAAVVLGKPAVFASVYQYEGQLQVYRPDHSNACLRCLWPEATRDGIVGNCAEAGVLGPVPGLFGSLQALEVLKIVLDLPGQLRDEILLFDLLTLQSQKLRVHRAAECSPGPCRNITVVKAAEDVTQFDLQLDPDAASAQGFKLIDIRDPNEMRDAPLQLEHLHIPAHELLDREHELDRDTDYVLVCARGIRSRAIADQLRKRGWTKIYSLAGGLARSRTPHTHEH